MIVETAIVCVTAIVVASLGAAARIVRLENEHAAQVTRLENEHNLATLPKPKLTKEVFEEKRRILTEQRRLWFESWQMANKVRKEGGDGAPAADAQARLAWSHIERLDGELLKLVESLP